MSAIAEAYEPPPPNELVRPAARVVLATLILMGVCGWVFGDGTTPFKLGMCAVTTVIEVWGFNAAVQWSRALSRHRVGGPFFYWTLVVVSCSGWTIFSLYHALALIAGDMGAAATPAYVAFTSLALCLPFHEWAIERVESADKKPVATPVITPDATGVAKRHDTLSQSVTTEVSQTVATRHDSPRRKLSRQSMRRVATELSRQSPEGVANRHDSEEIRVATRAPPLSEHEIREAVEALTKEGQVISLRAVARYHDVPMSRVERSPAKSLLKIAA